MIRSAEDIWNSSTAVRGTLGAEYLDALGVPEECEAVRFSLRAENSPAETMGLLPSVVFAFQNSAGIIGLTQHFIDPDTSERVRRVAIGTPEKGIWLARPLTNSDDFPFLGKLCIAEGLERTIELTHKVDLPCAAVISQNGVSCLTFPQGVSELVIDDAQLSPERLEAIRSAMQSKAYLVSSLQEASSE
ncbi:DUF7146 domain-containing protein [Qipengyuania sp. DGS5-3]|uniref:DUF7146 domain-containing protein n=1 Tax=Qipengyuania sp. DGS5-3 TaxID=3349632 RepID=UPI003CD0D69E